MAAHYVVIDGLRLPAKLGGHPALDFCNTLSGWDGHDQWDYLASYEHLAVWSGFAGTLSAPRAVALRSEAGRRGKAAAAVLEEARAFRTRIYDVLRNGPGAQGFERVIDDISAATAQLRLGRADSAIQWDIDSGAGLAAPMAAVAWSAGQLLTSPDLALVRACPGQGCGWLFLDRRGRRRWCTMTTCGNRAKVKRFAARQRGTAS